jgi:hypothetical protein
VVSGPDKGAKVAKPEVFAATGDHADKELDFAAERKDKPTVYFFVNAEQFDRPMNRFMRELDKVVKAEFADTYMVAVWLTGDVDKTKEFLPRVQMSVKYEATALTCFPGDKSGPKDWNVNGDARLTVVVANKGKVTATFGYQSVNDTDVPKVKEAIEAARREK